MIRSLPISLLLCFVLACTESKKPVHEIPQTGPIQLHPVNPHYFLYHGEPKVLITSGEHYGAVINGDLDYDLYLKTLNEAGLNYTRVFTGTYFEIPGSFNIKINTLAPDSNSIILPWASVITDLTGEIKYDLSTWNTAYFDRLKDLIRTAATYDIIVEVTLFSSIYRDEHWEINPQNPVNNINLNDKINRHDAQTLNNGGLLKFQLDLVEKLVKELNEFDNFFFEIQNEPWADHTKEGYNIQNKETLTLKDWGIQSHLTDDQSMLWQKRIASTIESIESKLPKKHLIAQNFTNYMAPLSAVDENISIINFHYAWPEAVKWNYHFDKVIGFDESGFAGSEDIVYRRQAWKFILSGGGLFNNLDYSFYAGFENGKGEYDAPGGGSESLRFQLKILSEFIHRFDLTELKPDCSSIVQSPGLIPYLMKDGKGNFGLYLRSVGIETADFKLKTENGIYTVQSLNPVNGKYSEPWDVVAQEGILSVSTKIPEEELALKISEKN